LPLLRSLVVRLLFYWFPPQFPVPLLVARTFTYARRLGFIWFTRAPLLRLLARVCGCCGCPHTVGLVCCAARLRLHAPHVYTLPCRLVVCWLRTFVTPVYRLVAARLRFAVVTRYAFTLRALRCWVGWFRLLYGCGCTRLPGCWVWFNTRGCGLRWLPLFTRLRCYVVTVTRCSYGSPHVCLRYVYGLRLHVRCGHICCYCLRFVAICGCCSCWLLRAVWFILLFVRCCGYVCCGYARCYARLLILRALHTRLRLPTRTRFTVCCPAVEHVVYARLLLRLRGWLRGCIWLRALRLLPCGYRAVGYTLPVTLHGCCCRLHLYSFAHLHTVTVAVAPCG